MKAPSLRLSIAVLVVIVVAQIAATAAYVYLIHDDVAYANKGAISGRISLVERLFPVPVRQSTK